MAHELMIKPSASEIAETLCSVSLEHQLTVRRMAFQLDRLSLHYSFSAPFYCFPTRNSELCLDEHQFRQLEELLTGIGIKLEHV